MGGDMFTVPRIRTWTFLGRGHHSAYQTGKARSQDLVAASALGSTGPGYEPGVLFLCLPATHNPEARVGEPMAVYGPCQSHSVLFFRGNAWTLSRRAETHCMRCEALLVLPVNNVRDEEQPSSGPSCLIRQNAIISTRNDLHNTNVGFSWSWWSW